MSDDDDYSLSRLTQEDPAYRNIQCNSDEESIDNLHALFEFMRKLAGGEIKDFGEAVFDLSQVEKLSHIMSSAISVGSEEFENVPEVLTYSNADEEKEIDVCLEYL